MYIEGEKLKECPFCGSEAAMWEDYRYRIDPDDAWHVYGAICTNSDCIAHQKQKFYFIEDDARKAWNRRVTSFQYDIEVRNRQELVRCDKCAMRDRTKMCHTWGKDVKDDDYCSYGKWKKGELPGKQAK